MSGRKQHIVPQFLQKGFANNGQIEVYSKNKTQSYIASIKDNFAERDFYSNPQEPLIDDYITKQENQFAPCIDNLRTINESNYFVLKNNNILLDTIINFSLRNKEIQKHIIEDTINELFFIIENINSSNIRQELKKRMKNNQKSNQVLNMMKGNLFEKPIKDIKNELLSTLQNQQRQILLGINTTTVLDDFFYQIITVDDELILSDNIMCCIQTDNSIQSFPDKESQQIYLPISYNKFIFLFKENKNINNFNTNQINLNMAMISSEKFISKNKSFYDLKEHISKKSLSKILLANIIFNKQTLTNKIVLMIKNRFETEFPDLFKKTFK